MDSEQQEQISIQEVNFLVERMKEEYGAIIADLIAKNAALQLQLAKASHDLDKAMSANAGLDGE